jgi:hypothetical protein
MEVSKSGGGGVGGSRSGGRVGGMGVDLPFPPIFAEFSSAQEMQHQIPPLFFFKWGKLLSFFSVIVF